LDLPAVRTSSGHKKAATTAVVTGASSGIGRARAVSHEEGHHVNERVLQMRFVVETADYDEAVGFYRDVLGGEEELFVDSGEGAQVTILDMGRATLELSTPEQVDLIDRIEVGRRVSPRIRVAFEVVDAASVTHELTKAGAELVAPPTRTTLGLTQLPPQRPGRIATHPVRRALQG